ncbi:MAG: DNA/RNA non-specific endonuclease [Planctomycetes bacterium]|nr:DNA/RNA non-specific endonuclease [Planctomycetota bacterium]
MTSRFALFRALVAALLLAAAGCAAARPSAAGPGGAEPGAALSAWRPYACAGFPRATRGAASFSLLLNRGYAVGYSETRRDPLWACYAVKALPNAPKAPPRPSRFITDTRTRGRVTHDDYTGSGYDRGHMAPSYAIATRFGQEAQRETFLMSNICPQRPALNQQPWRKIEETIAHGLAGHFGEVFVTCGPIFDDATPPALASGVAVPSAFYCIVAAVEGGGRFTAVALALPQSASGTRVAREALTTIDAVEARTGLDFFAPLPDDVEERLEASRGEEWWGLLGWEG